MIVNPLKNNRILVIDDNRAIHDDFRKILKTPDQPNDLNKDEAALFGTTTIQFQLPVFEIDSAYQAWTITPPSLSTQGAKIGPDKGNWPRAPEVG